VLPVPNEEALRKTVLTGYLLNCEIPRHAKFDRKNYFYPDAPKNYQLTQYDQPSTANGWVEFEFQGGLARVRITRAHLEEDVGKSFHFDRHSGVDFNRAGVPLMEIVSEPDLTSADMAYEYLNALKDILIYGGVSDCDMEKGMVRCDVNVSVRPVGTTPLGAKIEIKNMNSFSGVRRALDYEIPRQIAVLRQGGKLLQSTRRWDDATGVTEEMRTKEHAHDYRYFPEPDMMPLAPTDAWLAEVRQRVVELPRRCRDLQERRRPGRLFRAARQKVRPPQTRGQLGHQQSPGQTDRDERTRTDGAGRAGAGAGGSNADHFAGFEIPARRPAGPGRPRGGQNHQQRRRAAGVCRDVCDRQSPRGDRARKGTGPGQRHRGH
jgi:hypothetical protein